MSKKNINKKQMETVEAKKQLLEYKHFQDYTEEERLFPIRYTFDDFIFEQEAKGNSKGTIDYYKRFYEKFKKFLVDVINSKDDELPTASLVKLKMNGLFRFYLEQTPEIKSVQTINNYLRAFRSYGKYCESEGYVEGFKCSIKEVKPPIKEVYTDEEIKKLRKKPPKDKYEQYRNYNIISVLLSTGARRNTLVNIKVSDVDLKLGTISFNTTKAHKPIIVYLDRKALKDIREFILYSKLYFQKYNIEYVYLFSNRYGEQLTPEGLSKTIADYNKSKGVEKTSIHLFRHTFAKIWITSGGDIFSLQEMLTHSELDMVKRYSNLYGNDLKNAVNKFSILSQTRTTSGETMRTVCRNQDRIA